MSTSAPFDPLRRVAALMLVFATACGGDSSGPAGGNNNNQPPPAQQANDISIDEGASSLTVDAFNPSPKPVSLGGGGNVSVRWVNRDITGGDYQSGTATVHRIEATNPAGAFPPSGNLGGNQTHTVSFTAQGTYDYHCSVHPNMVGTIVVNP
ncbi:MAG: cupredoxin domain-containing protein [Gemmatimonadales bacterium]